MPGSYYGTVTLLLSDNGRLSLASIELEALGLGAYHWNPSAYGRSLDLTTQLRRLVHATSLDWWHLTKLRPPPQWRTGERKFTASIGLWQPPQATRPVVTSIRLLAD